MKFNHKKSNGFTLVELLLVVGIIALGSVVAYITLPKVQSTASANAEAADINTIAAGIKNSFGGRNNFASLNSDAIPFVVKTKIVPDKMVVNSTTLANSFGGPVFIGVESNPVGLIAGNATFHITSMRIPEAVCQKLTLNIGSRAVRATVNGIIVKSGIADTPTELTIDRVLTSCSSSSAIKFWFN